MLLSGAEEEAEEAEEAEDAEDAEEAEESDEELELTEEELEELLSARTIAGTIRLKTRARERRRDVRMKQGEKSTHPSTRLADWSVDHLAPVIISSRNHHYVSF